MGNLVCKICKSTDVTKYTPGIFGDSRHKCNSCGEISFTADFIEPTFFDRITASPEVLAEKLVYALTYGCSVGAVKHWYSTVVLGTYFSKKEEAIAATVARLKEVCVEQTTSNNR